MEEKYHNSTHGLAMPRAAGEPILDESPRLAFRVAAYDIIESIRQQFSDRRLAFRELGQNSTDAGATKIRISYRHDDGCMVAEFLDDGCGMTRDIIMNNYLRLFDSTKENSEECIGYYSLGRISAFVYPLESLELITLSEGCPGYRLVINADYSGQLYEVEAGETAQLLHSEHGTLVRLRYPVGNQDEFVKETESINESIKRELCWLHPEVKTTVFKREDDKLERSIETINSPLTIPGRLAHTVDVKLASGLGSATVAMGVEGETTRISYFKEEVIETGLVPITLCIGRIPALRTHTLPWTGGKPFSIYNLRVVIDSFQFKTNIGRNIVYLDTVFVRELLPKVFHNVILGRYIPALAKAFTSSSGRAGGSNVALRKLLCDICTESSRQGYKIPEEIFDTPILPALYRRRDYTLRELDKTSEDESIYYTYKKKDIDDRLEDDGEDEEGAICISCNDIPYNFKEWLELRYGRRFTGKNADFIPQGESDVENRTLTMRLRELLSLSHALAGLDRLMLTAEGKKFSTVVSCGYLIRFDGRPESRTPAHVYQSPDRVVLNLGNPHIRRLLKLLDGDQRALAAHFLFREVLFATDQKLPVAHREQLLTDDLRKRFGSAGNNYSCFEDVLKAIGDEMEPF